MTARFVRSTGLPETPLDAAAEFYERILPAIREDWDGVEEIVVSFEAADHSHRAWRLAAIQELAREATPCRVNGVVMSKDDHLASTEVLNYLHKAPGVTGQLFAVDGTGAGIPGI